MIKNNIIVAFSSDKACHTISNILLKNAIQYDVIVKTGANLRKLCNYYDSGVIVCGCTFSDEVIFNIIEDFKHNFTFIVLGSSDNLSNFNGDVYTLSFPIKQDELTCAINLSLYNNSNKIKRYNTELINDAKKILFSTHKLTEQSAHKYIQKKSMNLGKKSIEIAKIIIKNYKDI